ncbi:MAG: PAS domain-containing protein [Fibrobacter sp.]|nr:PAS domain-containing protein [Fibrobacter sp.]
MIAVENNSIELATFEANEHGRLISGNRRFCRMFGFQESEVQWHYVTDLCRNAKDWVSFSASTEDCISVRMKNRKGRSFCCKLFRNVKQDDNGNVVFSATVHRVGDPEAVKPVSASQPQTIVFLAKCAHCGEQVPVATAGEARIRLLCDSCAAKVYPEAYNLHSAQV